MSLRYIIDGYNVIHHPLIRRLSKRPREIEATLLHLIRNNRLCGKPSNKVMVVFDGFKDLSPERFTGQIEVVFSFKQSADEKIRRILEDASRPKDIIVVSDDREVAFFARQGGAKPMGVGEFLAPRRAKPQKKGEGEEEPGLSYSAMQKINQEMKDIWLR